MLEKTPNDRQRAPRQQRSRDAWRRILDAGVSTLKEGGYDGLTISALCKRAGVTAPSIYARARDKDALLLAIYDHAMALVAEADALDPEDPRWAALPPDQVVRLAVRQTADIWLGHREILRAVTHRAAVDEEVRRRGSRLSRAFGARFRTVLVSAYATRIRDQRKLRRNADVCYRTVYGALVMRTVYGWDFESDQRLGDNQLVDALVAMTVGYLGATTP